jgi:hypothetical protein
LICDYSQFGSPQSSEPGITNVVAPNINFRQPEKFVAFWTCLHDFFKGKIHPGIATDKVAVERLPIFEFHEHWMTLGRSQ